MENKKSDFKCIVCEDTGKIRVSGLAGEESGSTAPCDHCAKGAAEKLRYRRR